MVRTDQSKFYFSFLSLRILAGCSFSGKIPDELGNLEQLSFLYDLLKIWLLQSIIMLNVTEHYSIFPSNIELKFFCLIWFTQGFEFKQIHWRNSPFPGQAFQPLLVGPSRQSADRTAASINRDNSWLGPASECKAFVSVLYSIPRG